MTVLAECLVKRISASLILEVVVVVVLIRSPCTEIPMSETVSLKHDGTDGTGIQSVSPVPSASAAGPSVPSVSNSRSN